MHSVSFERISMVVLQAFIKCYRVCVVVYTNFEIFNRVYMVVNRHS
jgi:hypothetical protein